MEQQSHPSPYLSLLAHTGAEWKPNESLRNCNASKRPSAVPLTGLLRQGGRCFDDTDAGQIRIG